jgi:glycosyltransferase involved in cell wall biosynthesis
MKIAVIGSKGLPPRQGGIEHHCAEIYPRMVAQGHSVDLYARSTYTQQPWGDCQDFMGVKVISIPSINLRGVDAFVSSAFAAIAATGKQYDITHFHALGPALFTAFPKFASSTRVVVTCHGLDWQRAKWGNFSSRLIRAGEQAAVRFANSLVVVSKELQPYFLETYGKETVYITNAPASYPETDASFSYGNSLGLQQGKYVVFLGRLVPEKRPELLLEAFRTLKRTDWKLVFVGSTSHTSTFASNLLKSARDDANVIFAGELRGKRLAEVMRGAGLFVLPSDLEGLPLAMLEAMQEGIPIVASDLPVNQYLLDQDRGVLFRSGSVDSCVARLRWAIEHPQEMELMAQRAKRYVEFYHNWDRITTQYLQVYETVMAGRVQPATVRSRSPIPK